tara:strand:+ start:2983 stop:3351 length:369 start_codon:yes stop_codon:yes gene_type:complete
MPTTTITTAPNVAAIANLTMDQGATFSTVITVYQDDNILDLAGHTAAAQIRKSYSSSTSTAFTTAIDSTTSTGKITLSLTPTQTAALEEGRYVYDLEITKTADSTVTRPIQGTVTVRPNVTR